MIVRCAVPNPDLNVTSALLRGGYHARNQVHLAKIIGEARGRMGFPPCFILPARHHASTVSTCQCHVYHDKETLDFRHPAPTFRALCVCVCVCVGRSGRRT